MPAAVSGDPRTAAGGDGTANPGPNDLPAVTYPGLHLASTSTHIAGPGTHVYAGAIYASIAGRPAISHSSVASSSKKFKLIITIPRLLPASSPSPKYGLTIPSDLVTSTTPNLPDVNDIVLARVLRVRMRQVDVGILCIRNGDAEAEGKAKGEWMLCKDEWMGVVRKEDVRATEKDKVVLADGFRVGDLLRGEVISIGDQANYYLTTARNELGVLMAKSEAGNSMVPISWKEFKDPVTGQTELRKVAKPF